LILNETQRAVRATVRKFAIERIRPQSVQYETERAFPAALFEELASLGLMAMSAPEIYGGAALDSVSYALALMEIAAEDGALSTVLSIQNSLIVSGLVRLGSDDQKARFLPDLVSGRAIGAFALTESDAGSDASAIRTRAHRVEGGFRIQGAKQFITSGRIAKLAIVFAVTDPSAGKKGMSAFIVPTDRQGYVVDKSEHKLGQAASDTCSIRFDNLFVESDLMLGKEGSGYRIALSNLEAGRIGIAAQSVGMAQRALEIAVGYAKERRTFGKAIFEHQAVGFRLADLATRLAAAREMVLAAAALKDSGEPHLTQASMAKLFASESAELIVSGAMQTLGGYGYLEDFGLAKIYRDVRVCQIYEGTSDIQRIVISRSLQ
jgi:alkylation response protein AidB-like acyl-CoA dehydrogenase